MSQLQTQLATQKVSTTKSIMSKSVSKCYFTASPMTSARPQPKQNAMRGYSSRHLKVDTLDCLPFEPSSKKSRLMSVMSAKSVSSDVSTVNRTIERSAANTQSTGFLAVPKDGAKKLYKKIPHSAIKTQIFDTSNLLKRENIMTGK